MNIYNTNFFKNVRLENPLFPMVCKNWNKISIDNIIKKIDEIKNFIGFIYQNSEIIKLSNNHKIQLIKINQKAGLTEPKDQLRLDNVEKQAVLLLAEVSQVIKVSSLLDLFRVYKGCSETERQFSMKNSSHEKKLREMNVLLQNFIHASGKKVKNQTILLTIFGLFRSAIQINEKFQSNDIYKLEASKFIDDRLLQQGYGAIVENRYTKMQLVTSMKPVTADIDPVPIIKRRKTDKPLIVEQKKDIPPIPEDLILYLFTKLGFLHAPKVSLISKQYRGVFKFKYANSKNPKPITWSSIKLLKSTIAEIRKTQCLVTYFKFLNDLTKFDLEKILKTLTKLVEVFDSYLMEYPLVIDIICELFAENAKAYSNLIKPSLDRLQLRCSGSYYSFEPYLAIAYARVGDLKTATKIVNKLKRPINALEEIFVESLILNPDKVSDIIEETDRNCLKKVGYEHMKKLSLHLNSNQMLTFLEEIRRIGFRNCLIHGCILSNNFEAALSFLNVGWETLDYTGSEDWKENPYLHFIHASKKIGNADILLKTQEMLARKKYELTQQTDIKITLTILRAYLKLDNMTEAETIVNQLNVNIKPSALEFIAKKYAKMNCIEQAVSCLNKLEELSNNSNCIYTYYHLHIKMAEIYALFDKKKAIEKLEETKSSLEEVKEMIKSSVVSDLFFKLAKTWMKIDPNQANYVLKLYHKKDLSSSDLLSLLVETHT